MNDRILIVLTVFLMTVALVMIFAWVPTEASQGIIQRIFYLHVPSAWVSFLAFGLTAVFSALYLKKRKPEWDHLASGAAEIGVLFGIFVLVSGPLWAHREWGSWWSADLKINLALVLFLTYLAYLILRSLIEDEARRPVLSAVVGVAGFVNVPFVFSASRFFDQRSLHPGGVVGGRGGLAPGMLATLLVSFTAFTLLFLVLYRMRLRLSRQEENLHQIWNRLEKRSQP